MINTQLINLKQTRFLEQTYRIDQQMNSLTVNDLIVL